MGKYKVGDRVFSYSFQKWGKVIKVNRGEAYGLKVKFDCEEMFEIYTNDGKLTVGHEAIDLFFDEVEPVSEPPRKLRDKDIILCWDDIYPFQQLYAFYSEEDGGTFCADGSRGNCKFDHMVYVPDSEAHRELVAMRSKLKD